MKSNNAICLLGVLALLACRGGKEGAGIASATDGEETQGVDPTMSVETMAETAEETAEETAAESGGDFEPVLLDCPVAGTLPFTTQSTTWTNPDAQALAEMNPRNKDEASDILGNPGGVLAYTTMPQTDSPSAGLMVFDGKKQRTTPDEGLIAQPLTGENVSLWGYDGAAWSELVRGTTDATGRYNFAGIDLSPNPFQPYYAVLEGDQTCAAHYMFVLEPATKIILTDIDGTMTLSDEELFQQIMDGSYDPVENASASAMMNLWADKGYVIVYLTARPHAFRAETRSWLTDHGFPDGAVITANSLVFGESAREYKRTWVNRVAGDFGWDVVAAYGNAESDIQAYEDAGVPKDITFIVGEFAGTAETQAIEANDFGTHIADFVTPYPDA